jgi:hypothetical protein
MRATRSGYMFIGWWTATSGGSQIYDASGRFKPNSRCWTADGVWKHEGNAALYARWLPLTLGGNTEWSLMSDGSWESGRISNGQTSWLQTTVEGAGTLMFHWMVASAYGSDLDPVSWSIIGGSSNMEFDWMLDGVQQAKIGVTAYNWDVVSLRIEGAGTHTIKWRYSRGSRGRDGNDNGRLRNVYWSGSVK